MEFKDTETIVAYLQCKFTETERTSFEQEIASSPELKKEVDAMRQLLNLTNQLRLQRKVNTAQRKRLLIRKISFLSFKIKSWNIIRTAAAIILPLYLIGEYFYEAPKSIIVNEQVEITSAYGLVSKVTLPDGSTVWLNSGTTLTHPRYFTDSTRTVSLTGEAYFDVESNPESRFDVLVPNGMRISAYGTEFNVDAYGDDPEISTLLAEGAISVSTPASLKEVHLTKGQSATLQRGTDSLHLSEENIYVATAWRDGKLVFRREKMKTIAKRLSRHFNVDIELQGKVVSQYEYSATFKDETLSDILNLLEKSAPIECIQIEPKQNPDFSYAKRRVIIRGRR
jgi:ferric-dicitrate binding protein FerR (iron transport regulator)